MHELGVVFHVIKMVEEVAKDNSLTQIESVTLELGEVSTVIESYLQNCWKWAVANRTEIMKDAKLLVETIPAVTYCEDCEKTYETVAHGKICPYCKSEHTYLVQGNEFNIKEIEGC
jgi:hydrogenase nickel incorporation protein HypA/HybF